MPAPAPAAPPATAPGTPATVPARRVAGLYIGPPSLHELADMLNSGEAWAQARSYVTGFIVADHVFGTVADDEVAQWMQRLRALDLRLELEVGAVKEWSATGRNTFSVEEPQWRRIQRLGGGFSSIAMDEPLVSARSSLHKPDEYAAEQTAQFVAAVRAEFPQLLIGDIEPYPAIGLADQQRWIDSLQSHLARLGVRGLDFYRLDVDWYALEAAHAGSWQEVKRIEDDCHARGLPFSLIYWAADYPEKKQAGTANAETWYDGVMHEGRAYAATGGRPDQFVIESWIGVPGQAIPETTRATFTRSVWDFAAKFVRQTNTN